MTDKIICEKISEQSKCGHYDKRVLVLEVFDDCIVHEQA